MLATLIYEPRHEKKRSSGPTQSRLYNHKKMARDSKFRIYELLSLHHPLETTYLQITMFLNTLLQILSCHPFNFKSLKKCRKNFGNRFTNENLTPKYNVDYGFFHCENIAKVPKKINKIPKLSF